MNPKKLLFASLFAPFLLLSNPTEENEKINGIVLLPDPASLSSDREHGGVVIQLPSECQSLSKRLQPFLNKELNQENILKIKEEIQAYFREEARDFIIVQIPEQEVTNGEIAFIVTEGVIDQIRFVGNRNFSDKTLNRYLTIQPGQQVNKEKIISDVSWLNRNPFHRTEVVFSQGEERGTTDLDLVTQDRFRLRLFAGADNTGNDFTGNLRYFSGFNVADLFFADLLSFQFTSTKNFTNFNAYTANYTLFLPWKNTLIMWGGYATIRPFVRGLRNEGRDFQGSVRYIVPFKPLYPAFTHEIDFGADFKEFNSSLFFTSELSPLPIVLADPTPIVPLITNTVNLLQMTIAYKMEYNTPKLRATFQLENFVSPGQLISKQTKAGYDELRYGARPLYYYAKAAFGGVCHLTPAKWTNPVDISWLIRGQASTTPLLPSEQFGLGGYDTVRGYDEREILADDALCVNFEIRLPVFPLIPKIKNEFTILGFFDYGYGYDLKILPTEENPNYLVSVGPGIRYTIIPYLVLRADYGFQLHHTQFNTHKVGKFNLGAALSF